MDYPEPLASLVYDGQFHLPPECGVPRDDQLQGTDLEKLCELAGRECYDSLGRGRDSVAYHKHILQVRHLSVYEHANLTVGVRLPQPNSLLPVLINRPGVWTTQTDDANVLRVTFNLRAAAEWLSWSGSLPGHDGANDFAYSTIVGVAHSLAPQVVPDFEPRGNYQIEDSHVSLIDPETDEEKWVSMRMTGSRGLTHEQVRHGDFTAISQRSTRYVDESKGPWILHPLMRAFIADQTGSKHQDAADKFVEVSRDSYETWVELLEPWLIKRGVDATTARKQARGAARGFLGNALGSSMIFSANVAQWRRMLFMRASAAADAEIRCLYAPVLRVLKECAYADSFADLSLVPSPDGIGEVLQCQSET